MSRYLQFCCPAIACLLTMFAVPGAADEIFDVVITGEVEFNQIASGTFAGVQPGDQATITFQVDSANFDNGMFPVRGYEVIQDSFQFDFGGNQVGLEDPFSGTPYFVIRNDDPAVDGFFLGTSVDGFPNGLATSEPGVFGQFMATFSVSYNNDPLPSLDIADAVGTYDFTGIGSFDMGIMDGPAQASGILFESLTISRVPEPTLLLPLATLAIAAGFLRRKSG